MKLFLPMVLVLATLGVVGAIPQTMTARSELDSLVEAERSFSRTCVARGLRAAFMEFFAEDGIRFLPHPVNALENFRQRPAPAEPQSFTLSWEPVFADVSKAGDLGFTTGPYVVTDKARKNPPAYGYYFSIWRKQNDSSWRVLLDYGTNAPPPANPDSPLAFKSASATGWTDASLKAGENDRSALIKLDRETSAMSASRGVTETYRYYLLNDARLHRANLLPLVDKSSILTFLDQQQWTKVSFEPIAAGLAQSGDLAYSYGKYSLLPKDAAGALEKGYYARVWKRDGKGNWKIAMDVANPLPPEPTSNR
jgi:ketosteroid isomerase-like protein